MANIKKYSNLKKSGWNQTLEKGDIIIMDDSENGWLFIGINVCIFGTNGKDVGIYFPLDKLTGARVKYRNQAFIFGGDKNV